MVRTNAINTNTPVKYCCKKKKLFHLACCSCSFSLQFLLLSVSIAKLSHVGSWALVREFVLMPHFALISGKVFFSSG